MKINKFLIIILLFFLTIEVVISQSIYSFPLELQLILDTIFAFYVVNRKLFLEEQQYNRNEYLLNYNNLIILIFLYLESVNASNLFFINVIFVFLIPFIVVIKEFPKKINVIFMSILIIYISSYFVIKNYFVMSLFNNIDLYIDFVYISKLLANIFINSLLIILFCVLLKKRLRVKKKV